MDNYSRFLRNYSASQRFTVEKRKNVPLKKKIANGSINFFQIGSSLLFIDDEKFIQEEDKKTCGLTISKLKDNDDAQDADDDDVAHSDELKNLA